MLVTITNRVLVIVTNNSKPSKNSMGKCETDKMLERLTIRNVQKFNAKMRDGQNVGHNDKHIVGHLDQQFETF